MPNWTDITTKALVIIAAVTTIGGVAAGAYLLEDRYAKIKFVETSVNGTKILIDKDLELLALGLEQITIGQSRNIQQLEKSTKLNGLYSQRYSLQDRIWFLENRKRELLYYSNNINAPMGMAGSASSSNQLGDIDREIELLFRRLEDVEERIYKLENQ
jgi:hypothetical protein